MTAAPPLPGTSPPALPNTAAELHRLRNELLRSRGTFSLIVVQTTPAARLVGRDWLRGVSGRGGVPSLRELDTPGDVERLLRGELGVPEGVVVPDADALIDTAATLRMLNLHRDRLPVIVRGPFVLVLGLDAVPTLADRAPDLWDVRAATMVIDARPDVLPRVLFTLREPRRDVPAERGGDPTNVAALLVDRGQLLGLLRGGDLPRAAVGPTIARVLDLTKLALTQGREKEAFVEVRLREEIGVVEAALAAARASAFPRGEADALALRGALRMRLRELREARDDYAAAAALYDRLAASREALEALDRLTVVLDEMDEREEALRVLDAEVRPRAERLSDRPSILRARERIARHHAAARRMDEALAGFRALVEAHERDGNLADALYLEVAVAQIHLARGDALHARNDFTRLVDAARRLALPECEASATLGKAHALVTMGEHQGALEALGVLEGLVRAHRLSATFDAIVAQLRGQISQPAVAAP